MVFTMCTQRTQVETPTEFEHLRDMENHDLGAPMGFPTTGTSGQKDMRIRLLITRRILFLSMREIARSVTGLKLWLDRCMHQLLYLLCFCSWESHTVNQSLIWTARAVTGKNSISTLWEPLEAEQLQDKHFLVLTSISTVIAWSTF